MHFHFEPGPCIILSSIFEIEADRMSASSVHATRALENSYVNPKEAALDKAFQKNLLRCTETLSSKADSFSNFSNETFKSLRKLLSSNWSQMLGENGEQQSMGDESSAQTDMLLSLLVSGIKMRIGDIQPPVQSRDLSACSICMELLNIPVTFACGHSACKGCAANATHCKTCDTKINKGLSVNVMLSSILQNLFPFKYVGLNLTSEGDELMRNNRFQDAISKYSEAIQLAPKNSKLLAKRAKAYAKGKNFAFAIQDCERILFVTKDLLKSHSIKAEVFQIWGKNEEALMNCLLCAAMEPAPMAFMQKADTIMSKMISEHKQSSSNASACDELVGEASPENTSMTKSREDHDIFESEAKVQRLTEGLNKTDDANAVSSSSFVSKYNSSSESEKDVTTKGNSESLMELMENLTANITNDFVSMCGTEEESDATSEPAKDSDNLCMIDATDLECSLCMRLFYEPVCTPCGHLFCKRCLERTLDHGVQCPLCKCDLQQSAGSEIFHPSVDVTSEAIIKKFLPLEYDFTVQQHQEEVRQLKETIPLFVCTLAFPSVPCPLHVYEPRYRLMLRRVLDIHGREFGMCMYSDIEQYHKTGTMLNVKKASFFHDGRSVVESIGTKRFTVVEKKSCDGYDTGIIEYIIDEKVEDPVQLEKLKKLCMIVYSKSKDWYQKLQPQFKEPIAKHFGEFPKFDNSMGDNGPNWTWWVLAVLPVEDKMKIVILGKKKILERLLHINKIVTCLLAKRAKKQECGVRS